jgi:hypothetical protein
VVRDEWGVGCGEDASLPEPLRVYEGGNRRGGVGGVRQGPGVGSRALADRAGVVVVLEGNGCVAAPGGPVALGPGASGALAANGTGSVLAGLVGTFMARGMDPFAAAAAAVIARSYAGDVAATRVGVGHTLAGDVIQALPKALAPPARLGAVACSEQDDPVRTRFLAAVRGAVFPATGFQASSWPRVLLWRSPQGVGLRHTLDGQPDCASSEDLVRRSSERTGCRLFSYGDRRPVSRVSGSENVHRHRGEA